MWLEYVRVDINSMLSLDTFYKCLSPQNSCNKLKPTTGTPHTITAS